MSLAEARLAVAFSRFPLYLPRRSKVLWGQLSSGFVTGEGDGIPRTSEGSLRQVCQVDEPEFRKYDPKT